MAFLAGCGNVLLTNPIWVVATRMQALQKKAEEGQTSKPAQGPISVARDIWSESGILVSCVLTLPDLALLCPSRCQSASLTMRFRTTVLRSHSSMHFASTLLAHPDSIMGRAQAGLEGVLLPGPRSPLAL